MGRTAFVGEQAVHGPNVGQLRPYPWSRPICSIAYILLTKTRYPLCLNGFNMNGVQEAAGSNPVTRTKSVFRKEYGLFLFIDWLYSEKAQVNRPGPFALSQI